MMARKKTGSAHHGQWESRKANSSGMLFGDLRSEALRHRRQMCLCLTEFQWDPNSEFVTMIASNELCELKMNCEIIEVSHVQDARVYPCGWDAIGECSDCGTRICGEHAQNCGHCKQLFCLSCLSFHERTIRTKKPGSSVPEEYSRKQA